MALNTDLDNAHAYITSPWTGGDGTLAFWCYKNTTTARPLVAFCDSADGGDLASATVSPAFRVSTISGPDISSAVVTAANSSSSNAAGGTYSPSTWFHVVARVVGSSYNVTVKTALNGTPSGSSSVAKDTTGVNRLQIGTNSTTESDSWFAHVAFWNRELSDTEVAELQTTLPNYVSGGAPDLYESFIGGTGGSFTLSAATIDSTYDSGLPSLGSGGSSVAMPVILASGLRSQCRIFI